MEDNMENFVGRKREYRKEGQLKKGTYKEEVTSEGWWIQGESGWLRLN